MLQKEIERISALVDTIGSYPVVLVRRIDGQVIDRSTIIDQNARVRVIWDMAHTAVIRRPGGTVEVTKG